MSSGGRLRQGKTYTASAGKSPRSSVRSQVPVHQPEVKTASPEVSSSNKMRSPRTKFKNVDEPSPEKKNNSHCCLCVYNRTKSKCQKNVVVTENFFRENSSNHEPLQQSIRNQNIQGHKFANKNFRHMIDLGLLNVGNKRMKD